jgi:hypothetical protein
VADKQWVHIRGQDRMGAADMAEVGNTCKEQPLEAEDTCTSSGSMEGVQQACGDGISLADTGRTGKEEEGPHTLAVQAVRNRAERVRTGWEVACSLQ